MTRIVLSLLLVGLLLTGCAPQTERQAVSTVHIGQIASLSGQGATFGEDERKGVALAVEEINAKGGINGKRLTVSVEDTSTDATATITAYRKLVDTNQVKYIIGPTWGTYSLLLIPLLESDDVTLISPSTGDEVHDTVSPYFFKTWPADAIETVPLIDYMEKHGQKRIATVHTADSFSAGMESGFIEMNKDHKVTIVQQNTLPVDVKDFRTVIEKIRSANVDAVYVTFAEFEQAGEFARQAEQAGLTVPIYGWSGLDNNPSLKQAYAHEMENVVYPLTATNPAQTAFNEKFKARYGAEPNTPVAATAYDATMLLAEALAQGENADSVHAALHDIKDYPSASGFQAFDANGWPITQRSYELKTMRNGQYTRLIS